MRPVDMVKSQAQQTQVADILLKHLYNFDLDTLAYISGWSTNSDSIIMPV